MKNYMDKKLMCPCGLTCCDCLFYKHELYETAQKLRELIKINDFDFFLNICSNKKNWQAMAEGINLKEDEAWEEVGQYFELFQEMPLFINILEAIIKIQCKNTCQETGGCSVAGRTHQCNIARCVKVKGYDGCWQCEHFKDCAHLSFVKNNYGYIIEENLTIAKEKGIEAVKSRGNRYYAWQREKKRRT